MKRQEFYQDSYAKEQGFNLLPKFSAIIGFILKDNPKNLLDLGCGDGSFDEAVRDKTGVQDISGIDISAEAVARAKARGVRAVALNIDEANLPFPDGSFDMVFCGELIEHLFDPDHLLQEIRRVLKPEGTCILTTPNLSFWINRIALLFGYQPFFTEVSTRYGVGHLFPFWLKAGHMRLFTYRAIRELIGIYGFRVLEVRGFGINTRLGLGKKYAFPVALINMVLRPFPALASDLVFVIQKT